MSNLVYYFDFGLPAVYEWSNKQLKICYWSLSYCLFTFAAASKDDYRMKCKTNIMCCCIYILSILVCIICFGRYISIFIDHPYTNNGIETCFCFVAFQTAGNNINSKIYIWGPVLHLHCNYNKLYNLK